MAEFSELALQITERELRALRIEQPDQIAAALVARLQVELGGQSWYVESGHRHRREAIRRAIANGTTIEATARAFGVSTRTVRRAMGSG